jgi:hypothetical protein
MKAAAAAHAKMSEPLQTDLPSSARDTRDGTGLWRVACSKGAATRFAVRTGLVC